MKRFARATCTFLIVLASGAACAATAIDATVFLGIDACVKIRAAVATCSIVGCAVDARGFTGAQSCSVDPFNGVPGVELVLGQTSYTVETTWKVTTGSTLRGGGESSVLKAKSDFGDEPIVANYTRDPATEAERDAGIRIQNIYIDGNRANNSTAEQWSHCVQLNAVDGAWVNHVTCVNPKGGGINFTAGYPAHPTVNSRNIIVTQNIVRSTVRNCVETTSVQRALISLNHCYNADLHGINLEDSSAVTVIEDVIVQENTVNGGGVGVFVAGIAATADYGVVRRVLLQANIVSGRASGSGVVFRGVDGLVIRGNLLYSPPVIGVQQFADTSAQTQNVVIDANVIDAPGAQGIAVNEAIPFQITNNKIRGGKSIGIQADGMIGGLVAGNVLTGVTEGIYLKAASKNNITNNVSKGNLRGIRLEGNSTDNVVANNIFTDNSNRAIYEAGTTPDRNIYSNNVLRDNKGYVTESSGSGTIKGGACPCYASVTHGLSKAPNVQDIRVTLASASTSDPQQVWVDNIGATTFRVNARSNPGSNLDFGWQVQMYR